MAMTPAHSTTAAARPRLLTPALWMAFAVSFGAMTSFYLLLSVIALYATHIGAGRTGAGLATGTLLLATVAGELATPRLLGRLGYRWMFAASLLLLGTSALAMTVATNIAALLAVCVFRGIGLAFVVVIGSSLVASLVPDERRGEGLGSYGVVVGVPAVLALPLGVWLAKHVGYSPLFVTSALIALAGLPFVLGLPGRGGALDRSSGVLDGLRAPALMRPAIVFFATTMAAGIVVGFVPLAVTGASGTLAALALLVQAVASTGSRWWAGRYGDRRGSSWLLIPGLVSAAVGLLALVLTASPAAALLGMTLFGGGFGVTQNASLTVMLSRVAPSRYGMASAVWNIAYDAGMAVGAGGFGILAARTGYAPAFAIAAALMLTALVPALHDRRPGQRPPASPTGG